MLVVICAIMATAEAQIAQAPSPVVGTAQGPSPASAFERSDKYILAPQPESQQRASSTNFQSGYSGSAEFNRSDKYTLPSQPTDDSFAPLENRELAAKIESGGNFGFVGTSGTNFVLNGKITYFSGSNDYFLILRCRTRAVRPCCCFGTIILSYLQSLTSGLGARIQEPVCSAGATFRTTKSGSSSG